MAPVSLGNKDGPCNPRFAPTQTKRLALAGAFASRDADATGNDSRTGRASDMPIALRKRLLSKEEFIKGK